MNRDLTTNEIQEILQSAGIQSTLQRLTLTKYILCEANHPTAEEILTWAQKNMDKISQATVYNTLNTLVTAGLLSEFKFSHSDKAVYDSNLQKHHHLIDENSGMIYDISTEDLSVKINSKIFQKFHIKDAGIVLTGRPKLES